MSDASGERLLPRERLRTPGEFRRVFREGVRLDGPLFALLAAPNAQGFARLGLAASRRVGGAVSRNRAKRLLREVFRRGPAPGSIDLVLIPKAEILKRSREEVDREYRQRLRRLAARRGGPVRPGPLAHD